MDKRHGPLIACCAPVKVCSSSCPTGSVSYSSIGLLYQVPDIWYVQYGQANKTSSGATCNWWNNTSPHQANRTGRHNHLSTKTVIKFRSRLFRSTADPFFQRRKAKLVCLPLEYLYASLAAGLLQHLEQPLSVDAHVLRKPPCPDDIGRERRLHFQSLFHGGSGRRTG